MFVVCYYRKVTEEVVIESTGKGGKIEIASLSALCLMRILKNCVHVGVAVNFLLQTIVCGLMDNNA